MFEQSQSIITGLKSALDAQTRIGTYNAHLERLAAQQPVKVKERTDKEAALTRKEQENHALQNEIKLLHQEPFIRGLCQQELPPEK
jgi:DNA repair protein SbcC/Rad50